MVHYNMSLIITAWVNEGIVLAADSRTSFNQIQSIPLPIMQDGTQVMMDTTSPTGHYFDSARKLFLLPNKCALSTCGCASINTKAIAHYIDRFVVEKITKETSYAETIVCVG